MATEWLLKTLYHLRQTNGSSLLSGPYDDQSRRPGSFLCDARAVDAEGHYQPNANTSVDVAITGPGVIEAFASGDTRDPQPFHAGQQTLFNGRALAVVRSTGHGGVITLSASGVGLDRADIEIRSQRAATSEPAGPETHRTASR